MQAKTQNLYYETEGVQCSRLQPDGLMEITALTEERTGLVMNSETILSSSHDTRASKEYFY